MPEKTHGKRDSSRKVQFLNKLFFRSLTAMINGIITSKSKILSLIEQCKLKHEVHDFPSGCSMIDIWINKDFVVIQDEPARIGFSIVKEPDISTVADEYFTDVNIILEKIRLLVKKNQKSN